MKTKYVTALIAHKKYGIPRSALRALAEQGKVRMEERDIGGPLIMKMYCEEDIVRFVNGK